MFGPYFETQLCVGSGMLRQEGRYIKFWGVQACVQSRHCPSGSHSGADLKPQDHSGRTLSAGWRYNAVS